MARCCSVPPTESRVYQSRWHPARGRAPLDHLDRESFDRLKSWLALRRSRSNWAGDSIEVAMVSRLTEVSIFVIGKQVSNRFTLWVKVTFAWLERASNIEWVSEEFGGGVRGQVDIVDARASERAVSASVTGSGGWLPSTRRLRPKEGGGSGQYEAGWMR